MNEVHLLWLVLVVIFVLIAVVGAALSSLSGPPRR
jgi:hypothetical protein